MSYDHVERFRECDTLPNIVLTELLRASAVIFQTYGIQHHFLHESRQILAVRIACGCKKEEKIRYSLK